MNPTRVTMASFNLFVYQDTHRWSSEQHNCNTELKWNIWTVKLGFNFPASSDSYQHVANGDDIGSFGYLWKAGWTALFETVIDK